MFLVPTFLRRKCQQIREHGEHKTAHGETTRRSRVIYLFLFGNSCVFVLFFLSKAQLWFVLMFVLINKWVIHSCLARLPRMDAVSEPFSNPPKRHQGTEQSEPATRVVVSSLWFTKIALHHPSSAMDVTTSAAELRAATRERHALRCRPRSTHPSYSRRPSLLRYAEIIVLASPSCLVCIEQSNAATREDDFGWSSVVLAVQP
jgi:hypothetical protein